MFGWTFSFAETLVFMVVFVFSVGTVLAPHPYKVTAHKTLTAPHITLFRVYIDVS